MIRIGVEESTDPALLNFFDPHTTLVRVPDQPRAPVDIDFYVAPLESSTARRQWPSLRGVKVVQSIFAGVDGLLQVVPSTVTLCDASGVHDIPISEWILGAILAMQKYFPFYLERQRHSDWEGKSAAVEIYQMQEGAVSGEQCPVLVDELACKTVLILGYGSIGKATEERLLPFGVNIHRVARTARSGVSSLADLDALLPLADILVCILPNTSETQDLIDRRRLQLLKPGALLVNAGRGTTVDSLALAQALQQRRIRAAIDVVDPEPLPRDHPLWKAPNLLLTPHVAGDSPNFLKRAFRFAAQQARRFAQGKPLHNVVTGEY